MIAPNINAAEQAGKYASGGAAAISILTEPTWFKGTLNDMMVICLFFSILFPSLLLFPHIPHLEPRCTCGKVWVFRWLWSDLHCLRLCHSLSSRVFSAFLFFFQIVCVVVFSSNNAADVHLPPLPRFSRLFLCFSSACCRRLLLSKCPPCPTDLRS